MIAFVFDFQVKKDSKAGFIVFGPSLGELPSFTYSAIFLSVTNVLAGHVARFFNFSLWECIFKCRGA